MRDSCPLSTGPPGVSLTYQVQYVHGPLPDQLLSGTCPLLAEDAPPPPDETDVNVMVAALHETPGLQNIMDRIAARRV